MSFVLGLVIVCLFTCGGLLWLTHDVNERIGARSSAQSIAFQAARSGAQRVVPHKSERGKAQIDVVEAEKASRATINALCVEYFPADGSKPVFEDGEVPEFGSADHNCEITAMESIDDKTGWQVSIEVDGGRWTVRGFGIARPEVGK